MYIVKICEPKTNVTTKHVYRGTEFQILKFNTRYGAKKKYQKCRTKSKRVSATFNNFN